MEVKGISAAAVTLFALSVLVAASCASLLADVTGQAGGGQDGKSAQAQTRPFCPDGWIEGRLGHQVYQDSGRDSLCLYVSYQPASWQNAQKECHNRNSFLITLENLISIDERLFHRYLTEKGLSHVWTGMHKEAGRQLWDDPYDGMPRPLLRSQQVQYGEATRGWTWDLSTFTGSAQTCGVYSMSPPGQTEASRLRREASGLGAEQNDGQHPETTNKPLEDPTSQPAVAGEKNMPSVLSDQVQKKGDKPSDGHQGFDDGNRNKASNTTADIHSSEDVPATSPANDSSTVDTEDALNKSANVSEVTEAPIVLKQAKAVIRSEATSVSSPTSSRPFNDTDSAPGPLTGNKTSGTEAKIASSQDFLNRFKTNASQTSAQRHMHLQQKPGMPDLDFVRRFQTETSTEEKTNASQLATSPASSNNMSQPVTKDPNVSASIRNFLKQFQKKRRNPSAESVTETFVGQLHDATVRPETHNKTDISTSGLQTEALGYFKDTLSEPVEQVTKQAEQQASSTIPQPQLETAIVSANTSSEKLMSELQLKSTTAAANSSPEELITELQLQSATTAVSSSSKELITDQPSNSTGAPTLMPVSLQTVKFPSTTSPLGSVSRLTNPGVLQGLATAPFTRSTRTEPSSRTQFLESERESTLMSSMSFTRSAESEFGTTVTYATAGSTSQAASEEFSTDTPLSQTRQILESLKTLSGTSSEGRQTMKLHDCKERHAFVCAADPVISLAPAGQCEGGWLGHDLLSRCYKAVPMKMEYHEASRHCELEGAKLAIVDSPFFASVTAVIVSMMDDLFGGSAWVDTTTDLDGLCGVSEAAGSLKRQACTSNLPFICQKLVKPEATDPVGDSTVADAVLRTKTVVKNMTSADPRPLVCPVQTSDHDDVVVWYKDGKPIPPPDQITTSSVTTINRSPTILELNLKLLKRLGVKERLVQPALLQGVYWCKVWRQYPLKSITSHRMFVRFRDVITLRGFVKSDGVSVSTAVLFNELGYNVGLPETIANDLQNMNERIFGNVRSTHPYLADILTDAVMFHTDTNETEFVTHLCLSTVGIPFSVRGGVVDSYLEGLHTELITNEDHVHQQWNVTLPLEQAFRISVTGMCSEAHLVDEATGFGATFPSTPANQQALSQESCDGVFVGYAICTGDLMGGAQWTNWTVDSSCEFSEANSTDAVEGKDVRDTDSTGDNRMLPPSKPSPALLEIKEVHVEQGNVADVTDRLAHILRSSGDLTDSDVGIVADVVDRIALVPSIPEDVGWKLVQSVSRVLDSPRSVLERAQRLANTSTRILTDLELFGEKLELDSESHRRYVTDNLAMEIWQAGHSATIPVFGFAATSSGYPSTPLHESRIMTISNRTWVNSHMNEFDVAIELPDELVVDYFGAVRKTRMTMAIFRKPDLFLSSSLSPADSKGTEANSAVISAKIGLHKTQNLKDKVVLIFRPNKVDRGRRTKCVFWDFTAPGGGAWSERGCVYNGTIHGRDICLCDHLTNFAVLMDFYGSASPMQNAHDTALSIISMTGLSLSILGLTLTITTFISFRKLRQGRAQQTLFNMAIALLCTDTLLLAGFRQTTYDVLCLLVAVLLHYFILVSFAWMLVEAVLQYLTFVKILGTYVSKYTLKTVLGAWGAPAIPVLVVLSYDYKLYRGRDDYCWMDLTSFYYAFALPVGVIVLFNLVMFAVIMVSLMRRPQGLRSNRSRGQNMETNIKAAFTIFVLLGLTWLFGFLAIANARIPFQYLFTSLSSLQGFLVFMLLVVRRRQFREQWRSLCCGSKGQPRGKKVTPTISNSPSGLSSSSFSAASNSSIKSLRSFLDQAHGEETPQTAKKTDIRARPSGNKI